MRDLEMGVDRFIDRFRFFRGESQQIAGLKLLYAHIRQADPSLLTEQAEWAVEFSRPTVVPGPPVKALNVPYFRQADNEGGEGYRECFSSSCAMLAGFWGKVKSDDAYNRVRRKFGDTTSADAQLAALRSLGLRAEFHTDGSPHELEEELQKGRPVAVGWLHKGPVSNPRGGGHWSVITGATESSWIHNDPNGEANLIAGGYVSGSRGAGIRYSRRNWNPRWMPAGDKGWYLTCRP